MPCGATGMPLRSGTFCCAPACAAQSAASIAAAADATFLMPCFIERNLRNVKRSRPRCRRSTARRRDRRRVVRAMLGRRREARRRRNGRGPMLITMRRAALRSLALSAMVLFAARLGAETVAPESVGLSSDRLHRIDELVQRSIDAGEISGAVTLVARNGKIARLTAQ